MSSFAQRSFAAGEISPAMGARADLVKYATGLKKCENWIVQKWGGVTYRPGTKYLGEGKFQARKIRLIPFIFNTAQTYVLEFGHLYIRVWKQGLLMTNTAQAITGASNASPCVITCPAHGYVAGQEVAFAGVGGMVELNGRSFRVANVTPTAFELRYSDGTTDVDSTAWGVWTSGGTVASIYEIVSTYQEADLFDLHYTQSADVITIAHTSYPPRELKRITDTSWTLTTITFGPDLAAPSGLTNSGGAGTAASWVATAVKYDPFEESVQSVQTDSATFPATATPVNISIPTVSGATEYNVFRYLNGIWGFVGICTATHPGTAVFTDTGITPDLETTPPVRRNVFTGSGNYPATVGYFQQRLGFGGSANNPNRVWMSGIGKLKNFNYSYPAQADDAVVIDLVGTQVESVRTMTDIGRLLIGTGGAAFVFEGDAAGTITGLGDVNPRQKGWDGSSSRQPIVINGSMIFVQARGSIIRDIGYEFAVDGYRGNDLTIFSAHLFENAEIMDWAYQKTPHSIVWCARDDGVLLGMTYLKEHEIAGWHQHTFGDGVVESVACVPEGLEDSLYLVIRRDVLGPGASSVRSIERMTSQLWEDVIDAVHVDRSLTFDGRNTNTGHTMALTGGTTWDHYEDLTLTSSSSYFTAADVGNGILLENVAAGVSTRLTITAYTSATEVTVHSDRIVPVGCRTTPRSTWTKMVDEIAGLWHLEGQDIAVFADRLVVANPGNPSYKVLTVVDGKVTLERPYGVIHAGLPTSGEIETLDLDIPTGPPFLDKRMQITGLTLFVYKARGLWVGPGPGTDDMTEMKLRDAEYYDDPVGLAAGRIDCNIRATWNPTGRIRVRQIDPVPATILAVCPSGFVQVGG